MVQKHKEKKLHCEKLCQYCLQINSHICECKKWCYSKVESWSNILGSRTYYLQTFTSVADDEGFVQTQQPVEEEVVMEVQINGNGFYTLPNGMVISVVDQKTEPPPPVPNTVRLCGQCSMYLYYAYTSGENDTWSLWIYITIYMTLHNPYILRSVISYKDIKL